LKEPFAGWANRAQEQALGPLPPIADELRAKDIRKTGILDSLTRLDFYSGDSGGFAKMVQPFFYGLL